MDKNKELWFHGQICLIIIMRKLDNHFGNLINKLIIFKFMHKKLSKEDKQYDKIMEINQILDFYFTMDF